MFSIFADVWLPPDRVAKWVWMEKQPSEAWLRRVFANRLGINPHLIRDICATTLAQAGSDAAASASAYLGHKDPRSTQGYTRAASIVSGATAGRELHERLRSEIDDDE